MSNSGFAPTNHPTPRNPIGLSDKEQRAKDAGADVSAYIAHCYNGRSPEEAIQLAGGKIELP